MSKLRANSQTNKQTVLTNDYENDSISRIRENKLKLQSLGVKCIATSLTSLVDDTNAKQAKGKQKCQMDNDVDYVPCCNDVDEEQDHGSALLKKTRSSTKVKGLEMKQTIAPMSMANFLLMSKKLQQAVVGDEALKKVQSCGASGTRHIMDNQNMSSRDQVGGNEETRPINPKSGTRHIMDDENLSSRNQVGGNEETRPINPGTVKKTRGIVYCRKLTTLTPGEKLAVEFDNDGIPVGANGSSFSFFLGNQLFSFIISIANIQGVFSFDSPELRKDAILRHARALFSDSRHTLKRKYFENPMLKTKADRMKNRIAYMLDANWKYLVNLWSSLEFQKEKCGRECSRLDLMLKSCTMTSDEPVNAENLANNMHAKAAMEKLKNEREQGLNDKTDEQIFQEVLGKDRHGADESIVEAKKDVEEARKEVKQAKFEAEKAKKEVEEARKEAETTTQEIRI
ncbi:hypothetical protein Cgig2_014383 [Carnegiea gigantea]|uniref:Uncharacterized protein n=1 Tax=Carnegiea gigantea TaxID=171969 RepID=A0A9Q1Q4Q9_9CARY|nr:hypothetical protein Cgig2_014383 [Carnegiea gigantea]